MPVGHRGRRPRATPAPPPHAADPPTRAMQPGTPRPRTRCPDLLLPLIWLTLSGAMSHKLASVRATP